MEKDEMQRIDTKNEGEDTNLKDKLDELAELPPPKKSKTKTNKSIHTRYGKCANCQIFGTFTTSNTKKPHLSDVSNLINYATLNSNLIYLPPYG